MADSVNRVWISVERGGYSHGQLLKFFAGGDDVAQVLNHLTDAFGPTAADNLIGHVATLGTEEAFDNIKAGGLIGGGSAPAAQSKPDGPVCNHGPRVFKTGQSAKGPWKAWMCSADRNAPDKCAPEWVK